MAAPMSVWAEFLSICGRFLAHTRMGSLDRMSDLPEELPPRRVAELLDDGGVQLVDVRERYEVEAGRIAGAVHIELEQLPAAADSLDRERPLVFYCRSGSRSGLATQAFRASGYDAHNLTDGLEAWVEDGLPIEPEDGRVA
jgi:rhodanese-related sulfurtransferase